MLPQAILSLVIVFVGAIAHPPADCQEQLSAARYEAQQKQWRIEYLESQIKAYQDRDDATERDRKAVENQTAIIDANQQEWKEAYDKAQEIKLQKELAAARPCEQ